jgi:Tfp pilus assembly protein PilV
MFGRRGRQAVTLVEILIAIGILTVSLLGILEMFVWSRQVSSGAELRAKASATARGVVEAFRAAGPDALARVYASQAGGTAGEVTWPSSPVVAANGDVQWQARLSAVEGRSGILKAEVRARWGDEAANPLAGESADSIQVVEWLPARLD